MSTKTYEPTPRRHVAFLGLGVMGSPMAGHLASAGHQVAVFNRAAATQADVVFACVGNDDDLRSVTLGEDGAFAGMKPGAVFVDHTTASAAVARELDAAARQRGLH